jgi:TusA-related sulfurtransferase
MTRNRISDETAMHVATSTPAPTEAPVSMPILEADGLTCGMLEPAIAAHLRRLAPGEVLEIRSDRTEAAAGIAAFVSLTGHTLVASEQDQRQPGRRYFVRKKPAPA